MLPCPSLSPRVCSNSCPLSQWCYLTISSSATLFFCLPSFPASGTFPMSWLLTSGGQSFGASASASVLPMNIQGWFSFRIDWFAIFAVRGTLKNFLQHWNSKVSILQCSAFLMVQLSHAYVTAGKTIALIRQIFINKAMSLLFNLLSRLVIASLPKSKCLLISWLQSPSAVILEPKKIKSVTASPSVCHEWWDWMSWSSFFECWVLSQFFTLLFHPHQEAL